ncbi:flagellar motor switch protein FliN/FliY [Bacillus oleivorans]|uniref:Flagellar motor switch protein FliN n=1 Tax=Bacillus oleivorans TaxID=1448271 RepID=A0A285D3C4_9BACI|nr:flagellar motor switch phosphatase FliY [Bacillus oleivorans]SNX73673.1 flagellar motor switch protein FliN/FliY [Bacillus oleivorans]
MMSDGMLSQDEIDALLKGSNLNDTDESADPVLDVKDYFNDMELDALGEIGNISFGSSATALSTLLNQKVEITTPSVSLVEKRKLSEEFPHPYVAIEVQYTDGFSGSNLLVIRQNDAAIIADLMLGGEGKPENTDLGEIQVSAVQEAMNQMMGSAATSMSTIFNKRIDISPPVVELLDVPQGEGTEKIPNDNYIVKVSFRLTIGTLIDSNIMQLLPIEFAKSMTEELLNPPAGNISEHEFAKEQSDEILQEVVQSVEPQSQPIQDSLSGNQANQSSKQGALEKNVQPAVFTSFEEFKPAQTETKNLNMLLDIPLQVTVELGRTKRSVREILELSSGSILELDKLAGEPIDILINNRLIAQGEVVVIDENFGVRVTDILSQSDRLKKLR